MAGKLLRSATVSAALMGLVGGFALSTTVAAADMSENEKMFYDMHSAIVAAEECRGMAFSRDQQAAMAHVIDEAINYDIGAGHRLDLIQDAKVAVRNVSRAVAVKGCEQKEITDMLALFDQRLAPAIQ